MTIPRLIIVPGAQVMRAFCDQWEKQLGVTITLSHEDEPLGTAGPLALAKEILDDGSGEPFFVLNSDVICNYPLSEMMAFHKRKKAEATILVTKVRLYSLYPKNLRTHILFVLAASATASQQECTIRRSSNTH